MLYIFLCGLVHQRVFGCENAATILNTLYDMFY